MATKTASRPSARTSARRTPSRRSAPALPAWSDLGPTEPGPLAKRASRARAGAKQAATRAATKARRSRPLDVVPSLRFGAVTLLVCVVVTLFVSHVYATRATLGELQDARRENERLRLTHQRLQGDVDRMTGPQTVMSQAARLGLEEGVAYGRPIRLGEE